MTASPRHAAVLVLALLLVPAGAGSAALAEGYDVTGLGSLGEPGSWAWDISNAGQIAGHAFAAAEPLPGTDIWVSSTRAVLWTGGSTQELGALPAGSVSIAHGVNDGGQVVGRSRLGTAGSPTAFRWQDGTSTTLATPAGHESEAFAVNDAGAAVGSAVPAGSTVLEAARALRWSAEGDLAELHDAAWQSSGATAINAAGDVAGWYTTGFPAPQHAVLWAADGTVHEIGALAAAPYSVARAVNDAGTVVGFSGYEWAPGNWVNRAFLWQDGQMTDLGALGGSFSEAFDVNASGHVVGTAATAGGVDHAFLWDGQQMIDLNTRIPAGSGWVLLAATGINDAGSVVGYGLHDGEVEAFQLAAAAPDPCPADVTGDGVVDVMDLVHVITQWGNCPQAETCTGDVDFDTVIGSGDLVAVITGWGQCPDT